MGNLVRDGIFTKPFWHITSDIFIPSIKKYGLGGVNPIATYELIDVFRTLVGLGNREREFDENWKKYKPFLEEIAEQT